MIILWSQSENKCTLWLHDPLTYDRIFHSLSFMTVTKVIQLNLFLECILKHNVTFITLKINTWKIQTEMLYVTLLNQIPEKFTVKPPWFWQYLGSKWHHQKCWLSTIRCETYGSTVLYLSMMYFTFSCKRVTRIAYGRQYPWLTSCWKSKIIGGVVRFSFPKKLLEGENIPIKPTLPANAQWAFIGGVLR